MNEQQHVVQPGFKSMSRGAEGCHFGQFPWTRGRGQTLSAVHSPRCVEIPVAAVRALALRDEERMTVGTAD